MILSSTLGEKRGMTFFAIGCTSLFLYLYFINRDIARIGFYLLAIVGLFLIYKDRFKANRAGFVLKACILFVLLAMLAVYLSYACCYSTEYFTKPIIHFAVLTPFILLNLYLNGWIKWLLNASLFYVVICIFSYALSDDPLYSAKYFESHYAVYLLTVPITYAIFKSQISARNVLLIFITTGIIIGFGAIADSSGFARSKYWIFDEYPDVPNFDTVGIGLGMNSIHFAIVTASILAIVVSSLTIAAKKFNKLEIILIVISILFLSFALAMSGGRSAWISVPFIFGIPFLLSNLSVKLKLSFLIFSVIGIIFILQMPYVHKRVSLVSEEITEYLISEDTVDTVRSSTSIGLRFELWRAAWEVFIQNPVIGAGTGNFRSNMQKLELGATERFHHDIELHRNPHSLYFKSLAERGVLGLISTLVILLLPGLFFLKYACKSKSIEKRSIAVSGGLVVIVFSLGGLTIGSLHKTELSIFYIFFISLFFGMLLSKEENISIFND